MPTLASQSSAATVRRARRRERRIAPRARPHSRFPHSLSITANRRHIRNRQSRDRASFDIDDCFNICRDGGYHRDPDVHLGSGVRIDVNQFAVLEQDVPCPSTPTRFPRNDFTFSYPSPCTSVTLESTDPAAEIQSSAVPIPSGRLLLRRCRWPASSKVDSPTAPSSPLLPSIPTTPFAEPRVKLPGSFPNLTSSASPSVQKSVDTGYLDGIKIPSPLLYHKRSLELLEGSSEDDINAELAKTFSLTCGRDVPEPDFESYKLFDDLAVAGTPSPDQHDFVAARLPSMKPSMRESAASRNIPHPPWVEQAMHLPSPSTWPPILTTTNTLTPMDSTRSRSDSDATTIGPTRSAINSNDHQRKSIPSTDLVFPKLNVPERCIERLDNVTSSALSKPPATKPDFIDDDPVTVFKRWSAFENAVLHPKNVDAAFPATDRRIHAVKSNLGKGLTPNGNELDRLTPPTTDVAACPTATCLALVPARLYEHQYIGWPRRPDHQPDYFLNSYAMLGSALTTYPDSNNVVKMAKWVKELGFEKQHLPKCSLATDITSSFDEDFRVAPEAEPCDLPVTAQLDESSSASDSTETPAVEVEDEGYFTCQESGSEISAEEATLSDDEWADWDWEPEVQEQMQNEAATKDEDVDVFGIGWGF